MIQHQSIRVHPSVPAAVMPMPSDVKVDSRIVRLPPSSGPMHLSRPETFNQRREPGLSKPRTCLRRPRQVPHFSVKYAVGCAFGPEGRGGPRQVVSGRAAAPSSSIPRRSESALAAGTVMCTKLAVEPISTLESLLFIAHKSGLYRAALPGAAQRASGIAQAVTGLR